MADQRFERLEKEINRKTPLVGYGEQFFNFQNASEEEKLPSTAYHLEGEAQLWYRLFKENEKEQTWEAMKDGLHIHYGPTQFENFFGDLTKLRQIDSSWENSSAGVPKSI